MVSRPPAPAGLVHSAASWRLGSVVSTYIPMRDYPTDADLWRRTGHELSIGGFERVYVPKVTVEKESERRMAATT